MNKNNNMDIEEDKKDNEKAKNKEDIQKNDDSIEDDNIINGIINKNKRNIIENGYESKTRKKNKILYFNDKYNARKSSKKIIRKNKSLVIHTKSFHQPIFHLMLLLLPV